MVASSPQSPLAEPSQLASVEGVIQQQRQLAEAVEAIIFSAAQGAPLNAEQWQFLLNAGQSRTDVLQRIQRAKMILHHQMLAGSAADLERAKAAVPTAAQKLDREGGPLREQIAELQRKLFQLEQSHRQALEEVERRETARGLLRKMAPQHVIEAHGHAIAAVGYSAEGVELREVEGRVVTLRGVLAINQGPDPERQRVLHCQSLPENHPAYPRAQQDGRGGSMVRLRVDSGAWEKYLRDCRTELVKLEPKAKELRNSYDAKLGEIDRMLDHWLPKS